MKYLLPLLLFITACNQPNNQTAHAQLQPTSVPGDSMEVEIPTEEKVELGDLNLFYLTAYRRDSSAKVNVFITDRWPRHDTNLIIEEKYFTEDFGNRNYHHLSAEHSKIVLDSTGLSETDTLTIFNVKHGVVRRYAVTDLQVIAQANPYDSRPPYSHWAFQVGFEIPDIHPMDSLLFFESIVHIGPEQPFVEGEIKPMVWEEISREDLTVLAEGQQIDLSWTSDTNLLPVYHHQNGKWHIFRNGTYYKPENHYGADYEVWAFHEDSIGVLSTTYLYDGESQSPAPISIKEDGNPYGPYQWCGVLFKGQPPVVTNLVWESFGCPYIAVMKKEDNRVWIHCDNWH